MRAVATVLLACVLLAVIGGCRSRSTVTDARRSIHCEVMPDAPERNDPEQPTKIITRVRLRCQEPGVDAMQLTLRLQKQQPDDTWADVTAMSFTANGGDTVPAEGERFATRELEAGCSSGVFRSHVSGASYARGVTKQYDRASPRVFDPCEPALLR